SGTSNSTRVSPQEKAEYERIYREALQARLSAGTVHVYLLKPDGHVIASMHVAEATKPDRLLAMLERVVQTLHVHPGEPLVRTTSHSVPPEHARDVLVLHVTARYVERHGQEEERIQPVLGTARSSQWASLPSEDWVVLDNGAWHKLLPKRAVRVGDSWDWDNAVSARFLTHFYPPTENTDLGTNRLEQQALRATVVSIHGGIVRARLEGHLRMRHPFYHKPTPEVVDAKLVGLLEFEPGKSAIPSIRLVTDAANYGDPKAQRLPFGVAMQSVPAAK
ncbi:MAG TPA: hypothetical protein VFA18_12735, partial [Gemmataceae bacterium]|nr:hypothetical protein [Gemmataceae bacterium]